MMKVTLKILAKDVQENDYLDFRKCAITRALHRAGLIDYFDGNGLVNNNFKYVSVNKKQYDKLTSKVMKMYNNKRNGLPIKNMNATITILN